MKSPALVLVLNDDPVQVELYSLWIEKSGYGVVRFTDSEEALHYLHETEEPPCLILTDLYMPKIDGWKICRLLRSPEYLRYNEVPIVVISATYAGADVEQISDELGADAFFSAPVKREILLEELKHLLEGHRTARKPSVLLVEDSRVLTELLKNAFLNAGFEVYAAANGLEARDFFKKRCPEVVVLDFYLPDTSGDILLEDFLLEKPHSVIIMMTTDPDPELAVRWMSGGATAYIRKPFKPEYLVKLCTQAMRERRMLQVEELLERRTRELLEVNERMGTILSTMKIGLVLHNRDRTVEWVNDHVRRLFPGKDPIGKICYEFFENRDTPCEQCAVEESFRTGQIAEVTSLNTQKNLWYHSIAHPMRDDSGRVEQVLGTIVDITKQEEARREQEKTLREKEVLLKEVHHRVKNNLAIVSALLNLQSSSVDNRELKYHFLDAISRIESMALVHEKLYRLNDFSGVELNSYLEDIVRQLIDTFTRPDCGVTYSVEIPEFFVDLDRAIPLGLNLVYTLVQQINGEFSIKSGREGTTSVVSFSV